MATRSTLADFIDAGSSATAAASTGSEGTEAACPAAPPEEAAVDPAGVQAATDSARAAAATMAGTPRTAHVVTADLVGEFIGRTSFLHRPLGPRGWGWGSFGQRPRGGAGSGHGPLPAAPRSWRRRATSGCGSSRRRTG